MRLDGKKVLVTGGTEGIGAAIVAALLKRRARVVTCARHEPASLPDGASSFKRCDLTSAAERQDLIAWMASEHPDTAVLINNAAIQHLLDFHKTGWEEIQAATAIMLSAGMLPILARQPEAAIVNITTGLALAPKKSSPVYCATKAGLRSFTRALRYQVEEFAPHVQVQEVLPPLVDTRMTKGRGSGKLSPEAVAETLVSAIERGTEECYVGKSRLLRLVMRVVPSVAYRILRSW